MSKWALASLFVLSTLATACSGSTGYSGGGTSASIDSSPMDSSPTDRSPTNASLQSRLDARVRPHVDIWGAPAKSVGLVIGVLTPNLRAVWGYGATTLGGSVAPTKTLFELGSVTKVYTGVIFGLMLRRGDLTAGQTLEPRSGS